MAARLEDYRGEFVQVAQHPTLSRQISAHFRLNQCSTQELRMVYEEIRVELSEIANGEYGPWFLHNLAFKLQQNDAEGEIDHLLSDLLIKDVIENEIGCRTLFNILQLFPLKKEELIVSNISNLLMESDHVEHLFTGIFNAFNQGEIERLFKVIVGNMMQISNHEVGNRSISFLVDVYGLAIVSAFGNELWTLLCNKKTSLIFQRFMNMSSLELCGKALVNKLVGRFADLSKCNYSNFFVQACFDSADFETCLLIARELDPHLPFLVTHRYGNYVVQHLIKRFKSNDARLPPCLIGFINNNRNSLQHDQWARFVLYAYDAAQ